MSRIDSGVARNWNPPKWEIAVYYYGKIDRKEAYSKREEAMARFNSLVSVFKHGVVGWSVSYPKEVT